MRLEALWQWNICETIIPNPWTFCVKGELASYNHYFQVLANQLAKKNEEEFNAFGQ